MRPAIVCAVNGTIAAAAVRAHGGTPGDVNWAVAAACASSAAGVILYG